MIRPVTRLKSGMPDQTPNLQKVAVAGAGIIGLTCAFELCQRGHSVTLFDPAAPTDTTSWAAAGMIAPAYELMLQGETPDEALTALCFESASLWQDFAARIHDASALPIGFNTRSTLAVARSEEELNRLEALGNRLKSMGRESRWLSLSSLSRDHGVSPRVAGGMLLPDDHQVDNRRLLTVLRKTLVELGASFVSQSVQTADDLAAHGKFDAVVWARGARETTTEGVVKGQALSLEPLADGPVRTVRFGSGYAVPKPDRIIIGASSERDFKTPAVDTARTNALLDAAIAVLPALSRAAVLERWTGFRPKGQGERPVIGPVHDGEFVAGAHYRNGVLLAPVTAKLIADQIEGTSLSANYNAFLPQPDTA